MAEYTKVFENPYPDGWKDLPNEETPITASALQEHTDAIENIEEYLAENPISGGGGSSVVWNQLTTSGTKIAEIIIDGISTEVKAPSGGGGSAVVEYGTTEEFEQKKDSYDVGTEFLITNDYEEPTDSGLVYSTEETQIGTFNGKPLYSRLFETTQNVTTSQANFSGVTIPDGILTDVRFQCQTSSATWVICGQGYLTASGVLNARGLTASGTVIKTIVICEYVKVGD